MERLTELKYDITKLDSRIKNMHEYIEKMAFDDKAEVEFLASTVSYLKELREYKQLEEQGLLLRLPCAVGTTVYKTTWWDDVTETVKVGGKTFYRTVHKHKVSKSTFSLLDIYDFGKTVFLTKAEAEQKLKEMNTYNGIAE